MLNIYIYIYFFFSSSFSVFGATLLWIILLWVMGELEGEGLCMWLLSLVTSDTLHVTRDMGHVTRDMQHVTFLSKKIIAQKMATK